MATDKELKQIAWKVHNAKVDLNAAIREAIREDLEVLVESIVEEIEGDRLIVAVPQVHVTVLKELVGVGG